MDTKEFQEALRRLRQESSIPIGYSKILDGMVDLLDAPEKDRSSVPQPSGMKKWPEKVALVDPLNQKAFCLNFLRPFVLLPDKPVSCLIEDAVLLEGVDAGPGAVKVFVDGECVIFSTSPVAGHRPVSFEEPHPILQAWRLNASGTMVDIQPIFGYFMTNGSLVKIHAEGPVTCHAALYTSRVLRVEE